MNECVDYNNDPIKGIRRVVCAAIKDSSGRIICGARHYDSLMHGQLNNSKEWTKFEVEQGFVDQWQNYMNRKDAKIVAKAANQIIRTGGGYDDSCEDLYSENLY